jgi:hypothetical protein
MVQLLLFAPEYCTMRSPCHLTEVNLQAFAAKGKALYQELTEAIAQRGSV